MKALSILVLIILSSCAHKAKFINTSIDKPKQFTSKKMPLSKETIKSYYPEFSPEAQLQIQKQLYFMYADYFEKNYEFERAYVGYRFLLEQTTDPDSARYIYYKISRIIKLKQMLNELEEKENMTIDNAFYLLQLNSLEDKEINKSPLHKKAFNIVKEYYKTMSKFESNQLLSQKEKDKIFSMPLESQ